MSASSIRPSAQEINIYGVTLLSIPFFALFMASFSFIMGGGIERWIFPSATIVAFLVGHYFIYKKSKKLSSIIRFYAYICLALIFSILSSAIIYDHSYDGNTYHQAAIINMLSGWNPFHDPGATPSPWRNHYAKSIEIIAATISICFNRIECGKAANIILILASYCITYSFLRKEFQHKSKYKILFLSTILVLCPVVVRQSYIYYNDFTLYIFLIFTIISLLQIYRQENCQWAWYTFIITAPFAATTKFTIAFYTFLAIAIAIVWIYIKGKRVLSYKLAGTSIILIIFGFGILGYHPYVTNTIGWGNPFYPLLGSDTTDIMIFNTPSLYFEGNRLTNWVRSLFYDSQGNGIWIPILNDSLHDYYISYDSRIAGFGPFFGYTLIGTIMLTIFVWIKKQKEEVNFHTQGITLSIISLLFILGCFIFEQSWWMRYVPFLWATPILLLLYTEYFAILPLEVRLIRNTLYSLFTATILLCSAATLFGGLSFTQRLGALYYAITPQSTVELYSYGLIISFEHKLNERNIAFRRLETEEELSDTTLLCIPFPNKAHIYVDSDTYSRLPHPDLMDFMLSNK